MGRRKASAGEEAATWGHREWEHLPLSLPEPRPSVLTSPVRWKVEGLDKNASGLLFPLTAKGGESGPQGPVLEEGHPNLQNSGPVRPRKAEMARVRESLWTQG